MVGPLLLLSRSSFLECQYAHVTQRLTVHGRENIFVFRRHDHWLLMRGGPFSCQLLILTGLSSSRPEPREVMFRPLVQVRLSCRQVTRWAENILYCPKTSSGPQASPCIVEQLILNKSKNNVGFPVLSE